MKIWAVLVNSDDYEELVTRLDFPEDLKWYSTENEAKDQANKMIEDQSAGVLNEDGIEIIGFEVKEILHYKYPPKTQKIWLPEE